jgi:hypothetical protein
MWSGFQEHNFPENHPILLAGFCEWNWVCETEEGNLWGVIHQSIDNREYSKEVEDQIGKSFLPYREFYKKIPDIYHFIETIGDDLELCALSRAFQGKENVFFERLFKAYQLGVVPCGWAGEYPEGKMVVYRADANEKD